MKNLERLSAQLTNPALNKVEVIKEIDSLISQTVTVSKVELLNMVKFQLQSPIFLREYCISEIKTFISKNA